MKRKRCSLFLFLFLSGCVGGTFGNHEEVEMYPLRSASESEAKALKRCLRAAYAAQTAHIKSKGKPYRKTSDMPVDAYCQGIMLAQIGTPGGYEIMGQIHRDESTVRWTINQEGVIEEHLDNAPSDADLEF